MDCLPGNLTLCFKACVQIPDQEPDGQTAKIGIRIALMGGFDERGAAGTRRVARPPWGAGISTLRSGLYDNVHTLAPSWRSGTISLPSPLMSNFVLRLLAKRQSQG